MISELRVGPLAVADGATITQRASKDTTTVVQDGHAAYQEAVYRGSVFIASNQAGVAITAGLPVISLGFSIYNPIASGKNLVIWSAETGFTINETGTALAGVIALAAGVGPNVAAPTGTTALTKYNALLNPTVNSVASVYSTATFVGAPVYLKTLASLQAPAAATTVDVFAPITSDIRGSIIIPPGVWVAFAATAALTLQSSMTWEEIPI